MQILMSVPQVCITVMLMLCAPTPTGVFLADVGQGSVGMELPSAMVKKLYPIKVANIVHVLNVQLQSCMYMHCPCIIMHVHEPPS